MLLHKAMLAGTNYEYKHSQNSYLPKQIPEFYKKNISPIIKYIQKNIYGLEKDKVNWFKWGLVNLVSLGTLFLDKNVGYPGTKDIRLASGTMNKVLEAIKSKIAYTISYFTYQGIIAWSYTKKEESLNPLRHLKIFLDKTKEAFSKKYLSTLAVAIADSATDIFNSSKPNKLIPSPIIAGSLRILLMTLAVKMRNKSNED